MQNRDQSSPSSDAPVTLSTLEPHPEPSGDPPASAFTPAFLEKLRLLSRLLEEADAAPSTETEAVLAGPLAVEPVETRAGRRWAVVLRDEPLAAGGKAAALYQDRDEALRAASVFPAVAAPSPYRLKDKPKDLGYPLHCHRRHVGHVGRLADARREALLTHLHVARYLATHPHALALLLESAGPEALPILGRALARRIEEALP